MQQGLVTEVNVFKEEGQFYVTVDYTDIGNQGIARAILHGQQNKPRVWKNANSFITYWENSFPEYPDVHIHLKGENYAQ